MKKLTGLLAVAGLFSSVAMAQSITAVTVSEDVAFVAQNAKVWEKAVFSDITLYPQTTLKMNDKQANEQNSKNKALVAKVGALYDGKNVAFKVIWADKTKDVQNAKDSDSFADGFAVQFANKVANVQELPYVGMGSEGRDVTVFLQKAVDGIYEPNGNGDVSLQVNARNTNHFEQSLAEFKAKVDAQAKTDYQKAFVSEGVRSMTEIKDGSVSFNTDMLHANGKWSGTLAKSLNDNYTNMQNQPSVPVVFAVWDGGKDNRDGLKMISSWVAVNLSKGETELSKATDMVVKGDVAKGKQIAVDNCAACHHFADQAVAPAFMAPNLSNIGGYATAGYLMESINNPSAVVVPGYNRNSHQSYAWYNVDEKGVRTSTMPSYDWLSPEDKTNLVAYLQTLKAGSK